MFPNDFTEEPEKDSMEEWDEMLRDFFPNDFNMAQMAVRNRLPYGVPDWLIESTTASFFNMFAYDYEKEIIKTDKENAKDDPFKLWTIEETNFKTGEHKNSLLEITKLYDNPN